MAAGGGALAVRDRNRDQGVPVGSGGDAVFPSGLVRAGQAGGEPVRVTNNIITRLTKSTKSTKRVISFPFSVLLVNLVLLVIMQFGPGKRPLDCGQRVRGFVAVLMISCAGA